MKRRAFLDGMVYGYLYGCCVGMPCFAMFALIYASLGHVQTGLVFFAVGAVGTWLCWRLAWLLREDRRRV